MEKALNCVGSGTLGYIFYLDSVGSIYQCANVSVIICASGWADISRAPPLPLFVGNFTAGMLSHSVCSEVNCDSLITTFPVLSVCPAQAHTHGLCSAAIACHLMVSTSIIHHPCKYMDYYLFTNPGGMEG